MINRKELVRSHNPKLSGIDTTSPITLGNGEFAATVDVTGLQTLYPSYETDLPLCIQSQWGWHTTPVSAEKYAYSRSDLILTPYDTYGRQVGYAKKKFPGNEEVYDWLRQNPHRLNLARIGFVWHEREPEITGIDQTLDLYSGILTSIFYADGIRCEVKTCVSPCRDMLTVTAVSDWITKGEMAIEVRFPYGSPSISASDWESPWKHHSDVVTGEDGMAGFWEIKRTLDQDEYYTALRVENGTIIRRDEHIFEAKGHGNAIAFSAAFGSQWQVCPEDAGLVFDKCARHWADYWETGGILRLNRSSHPKAKELERRVILSQYLTAVQCAGSVPPQETGLTCNSWYGKFHLEMHYWHSAHFHFWGRTQLLERSMKWYAEHLQDAKALAAEQGYLGARWPKMVAENGVDSPSSIAPLLIWQQPHLLCFLEYCYQAHPDAETLEKYGELVEKTAAFMADYAVYDAEKDRYVLGPPVIPAQERHDPAMTVNPTYELEYWRFGLQIASKWRERRGLAPQPKWQDILDKMAMPTIVNGAYMAHERCPRTFEDVATDHPSMLCAFGLLNGERLDPAAAGRTLDRVLSDWDYPSMWGWDFGVLAMTATLLGRPETAVEILLRETEKNTYVRSGNNRQISRRDLPLYLPGNGSLLLAVAMMAAGYQGCARHAPGFPEDGQWVVEWEGLRPLWY